MPNTHTPDDSFPIFYAETIQWVNTLPKDVNAGSDKIESLGELNAQVEESEGALVFPLPNLCPPLFWQKNICPNLGCWINIGNGFYPKSKRKWFS